MGVVESNVFGITRFSDQLGPTHRRDDQRYLARESQLNVNSQNISVNHPLQQNVASSPANESNLSAALEVDVRSGGEGVNSPSQQLTTASADILTV